MAKTLLSLPEIVAGYRWFLQNVAREYFVIIGIDELDKIGSDEKAEAFMNDIKAIFGLDGCFYLISVSENAMSNFERRGLPFRDVFDSSFDAIIYVDYLDFLGARRLLGRRVVGLPIPFAALCFCESGGLARDLIRACRSVVELAKTTTGDRQLASLADELVYADVKLKVRAASIAAGDTAADIEASKFIDVIRRFERDLRAQATTNLLTYSSELAQLATDLSQSLLENPTTNGGSPPQVDKGATDQGRQRVVALCSELAMYLFYCGTVLEFFSTVAATPWEIVEQSGWLDDLVRGRHYLAVNPKVAANIVGEFRQAAGLPAAPMPV